MDATAPTESAFASPSAFDGSETTARDQRYDNQPPIEERVMLEFDEDLERLGLKTRIAELLDSAERAPETIEDETTAGKIGDFIKLARDVEGRVDAAREKHNRPLINARNALKGKADSVLAPLLQAGGTMRSRLNAYIAGQERKAAAERARLADEERKAREALEREGVSEEVIARTVEAPRVAAPVARGDLGSRVGSRTVWRHELQVPIAKLPKQILENAKVRDAINQVVAAMVRAGTREIKGVRIWEEKEASVR